MLKRNLLGFVVLLVLVAAIAWFTIGRRISEAESRPMLRSAAADYALQDDSRVRVPTPEAHVVQPFTALTWQKQYGSNLPPHTLAANETAR